MKLTLSKTVLAVILLFGFTENLKSQYPPAQGPPPVSGEPIIREIPTFIVNNLINNMLRDSIVPEINASIAAEDPPVSINVSFTLEQRKPHMSETRFTDRPNEKIVTVPYKVDFKLDINNFPDRHILQNIEVNFSCNNWFTNSGTIQVNLHAERPFLGGPSFTEQAINFFLGNWLTPLIDSKIRNELPPGLRKNLPLELFHNECNCLSVVAEGASPAFKDSFIQYQKKPHRKKEILSTVNSIQITVDSIKRLPTVNLETGEILYDSVENLTVEFYANHSAKTFNVNGITEGQKIKLPSNSISVIKPGVSGSLILIANITQANDRRNTRFAVFKSTQNFGIGEQKLIIQKSFTQPPKRLPSGDMSKPLEIFMDAYEITVSIKSSGLDKIKMK